MVNANLLESTAAKNSKEALHYYCISSTAISVFEASLNFFYRWLKSFFKISRVLLFTFAIVTRKIHAGPPRNMSFLDSYYKENAIIM